MKLYFVYLSDTKYTYIWNRLTVETLIGDLKGYLRNELDYEFYILEDSQSVPSVISAIKSFQPDIVGISMPIDTMHIFDELIKQYCQIHHKLHALLTMGNILARSNIDYFCHHPFLCKIDFTVGLGHGEFNLRQLASVVKREKALDEVSNILYWDAENQKLHETASNNDDLSALIYPPITDTNIGRRVNMVQTSRGCFFNCSYCSQGPGHIWERLPFNRVRKNLMNMFNLEIDRFEFTDEDFFGSRLKINLPGTE